MSVRSPLLLRIVGVGRLGCLCLGFQLIGVLLVEEDLNISVLDGSRGDFRDTLQFELLIVAYLLQQNLLNLLHAHILRRLFKVK